MSPLDVLINLPGLRRVEKALLFEIEIEIDQENKTKGEGCPGAKDW